MPDRRKQIETMAVLAAAMLVVYYYRRTDVWIAAALLLLLTGLFAAPLAGWIAWGWLKIAEGIGFVMSKVVLSVVFFFFLTPIALLSRLFGRDSLQLKKRPARTTWTVRDHRYAKADLVNIW